MPVKVLSNQSSSPRTNTFNTTGITKGEIAIEKKKQFRIFDKENAGAYEDDPMTGGACNDNSQRAHSTTTVGAIKQINQMGLKSL